MDNLKYLKEVKKNIQKKYKKKLWRPFCKAINQYELVKPGDKIAVCISGGKDSMLMAKLFQELKRHNKMELKNLSTQLHVSTSSLCILLNKLVEKKYVYREEDKRDRRNTFYGITKEGLEVFDEQVMKFVDVIDEKIDKLSMEDKHKLLICMNDIGEIIGKMI